MRDDEWKTLITLHQYNNLTKAANALYLSQSTLTKQLHRIEQEFGVSVVKRSNRGIEFTPEGEFLVQQALKMVSVMAETRKGLWKMQGGLAGTLKIGVPASFAGSKLPGLLQAYAATNDQTKFIITHMFSDEVLQAVENETVHIGFVNGDREHNGKQVLCSYGTAYAVASRPITRDDLPNMDMIMHNRDYYAINIFESWWKNNFTQPIRIGASVQDIDASLKLVRDGLGYGVIFSNCVNNDDGLYKYRLLDETGMPIRRSTWAICKRDYEDYPLVENFMLFVEEQGPLAVE